MAQLSALARKNAALKVSDPATVEVLLVLLDTFGPDQLLAKARLLSGADVSRFLAAVEPWTSTAHAEGLDALSTSSSGSSADDSSSSDSSSDGSDSRRWKRRRQLSCAPAADLTGVAIDAAVPSGVTLDAVEAAQSALEDFFGTYSMFHDTDSVEGSTSAALVQHLPVLTWVEAMVYAFPSWIWTSGEGIATFFTGFATMG